MKGSDKVMQVEKGKLVRIEKWEVVLVLVDHDPLLPVLDANSSLKTVHSARKLGASEPTENSVDYLKCERMLFSFFACRNSTYATFVERLPEGNRSNLPHLLSRALELEQGISTRKKGREGKCRENKKGEKMLLEKVTQKQTPEEEKHSLSKNFDVVMTVWVHSQS